MGDNQSKVTRILAQSHGYKESDVKEQVKFLVQGVHKTNHFKKLMQTRRQKGKKVKDHINFLRRHGYENDVREILRLRYPQMKAIAHQIQSFEWIDIDRVDRSFEVFERRGDNVLAPTVTSAAFGIVGGASGPAIGIGAITAAGFTSNGVAIGSLAAAAQVPNVAAGSMFALLQSAGATGVLAASSVAGCVVGGITLSAAIGFGIYKAAIEIIYHMRRQIRRTYFERYGKIFQSIMKDIRTRRLKDSNTGILN